MSWTDERVETLKKMWADGQSASQIAKELGGVTRNAVIGKVHRLGLSNRVGGKGDEDEAAAAAAAAPAAAAASRPESRAAAPAADIRAAAERPAPSVPHRRRRRHRDPPADPQGDHPGGPAPAAAAFGRTRSAPRRWPRCARSKSARAA